jgi:hypothetical protein
MTGPRSAMRWGPRSAPCGAACWLCSVTQAAPHAASPRSQALRNSFGFGVHPPLHACSPVPARPQGKNHRQEPWPLLSTHPCRHALLPSASPRGRVPASWVCPIDSSMFVRASCMRVNPGLGFPLSGRARGARFPLCQAAARSRPAAACMRVRAGRASTRVAVEGLGPTRAAAPGWKQGGWQRLARGRSGPGRALPTWARWGALSRAALAAGPMGRPGPQPVRCSTPRPAAVGGHKWVPCGP